MQELLLCDVCRGQSVKSYRLNKLPSGYAGINMPPPPRTPRNLRFQPLCKDATSEQDVEHVTVCFSYQSVRLSLSCYGATSTWNPRHMNLVADSTNSRLQFSCAVLQAWSRSQLGENFYGCLESIIWPVAYTYLCSSVHISTVQRVLAPRVCHHQGLQHF